MEAGHAAFPLFGTYTIHVEPGRLHPALLHVKGSDVHEVDGARLLWHISHEFICRHILTGLVPADDFDFVIPSRHIDRNVNLLRPVRLILAFDDTCGATYTLGTH